MDLIDIKILEVLQENARVSISDLSKKVNLSLSAVSERLKKLENSKIISKYTVILEPKLMGKDLSVIISIGLESTSDTQSFLDFVQSEPEILECHYITGEYDYMLKVTTTNTHTLEMIMNRIKSFNGIKRTQTNVILSTTKLHHSVSPEKQA
ncbi:MAG: Lrp/AsnC family transcriptional regulator [Anaerovoracaceae bacterium]|nr:Lrp/AsnC family transcriptional regulator [Bacillota bacterium]MDD7734109.1 Lrp/AsnC family transcriptional regulator [Bacillota bacterium]MDY5906159.1 Lrp/AsnC family transcriptional regulator [Anaerovoracaceae bacterium]